MNVKSACAALGPLYRIEDRDKVPSIVRRINDSLEFEITGPFDNGCMTVNLWLISPHRELLAIYSGIATEGDLADTLGYLSFRYQSLQERIRVEREDLIPGWPAPAGLD